MNIYIVCWFIFLATSAVSLGMQLQNYANRVQNGVHLRTVLKKSDAKTAQKIKQIHAQQQREIKIKPKA